MPKEVSAGAVVFRRENSEIYYLLLYYEAGHWDFPKGNIEEDEKEEDTVRREVKEETGIEDIEIIQGFKEWIKYFYRSTYGLSETDKKKIPWTFKIVTYYLAETKTPHQSPEGEQAPYGAGEHGTGQAKEVKISFEHLGYEWLSYQEALEKITYKNAKEILRKANEFLVSKKSS